MQKHECAHVEWRADAAATLMRGVAGLLNELLLGGRDAGDLGHLHLDILDGVATGDGERERGSVSFDEQLHTCVVAKTK